MSCHKREDKINKASIRGIKHQIPKWNNFSKSFGNKIKGFFFFSLYCWSGTISQYRAPIDLTAPRNLEIGFLCCQFPWGNRRWVFMFMNPLFEGRERFELQQLFTLVSEIFLTSDFSGGSFKVFDSQSRVGFCPTAQQSEGICKDGIKSTSSIDRLSWLNWYKSGPSEPAHAMS